MKWSIQEKGLNGCLAKHRMHTLEADTFFYRFSLYMFKCGKSGYYMPSKRDKHMLVTISLFKSVQRLIRNSSS